MCSERLVRLLVAVVLMTGMVLLGDLAPGHAGEVRWPSHLRLLTGPSGGQWWTMGEPLAKLFSAIRPTTARSGGGLGNINAVNAGQADIAFSLGCFLADAGDKEEELATLHTNNVALLANVYPQVFYVLLRKEFADAHGIVDLRSLLALRYPLRFATLKPGTASEFVLRLVLKNGYGSSYDTLRTQGWSIEFNNYAETADRFAAGDIDCFAYTAGTLVPLIKTMEGHIALTILPMEDTVIESLSRQFNMHRHVINPGTYKASGKAIPTLGDYTVLIVQRSFSVDLVEEMAKVLWEGRQRVSKLVTDFDALAPQTAMATESYVHPGARRFWETLIK